MIRCGERRHLLIAVVLDLFKFAVISNDLLLAVKQVWEIR